MINKKKNEGRGKKTALISKIYRTFFRIYILTQKLSPSVIFVKNKNLKSNNISIKLTIIEIKMNNRFLMHGYKCRRISCIQAEKIKI